MSKHSMDHASEAAERIYKKITHPYFPLAECDRRFRDVFIAAVSAELELARKVPEDLKDEYEALLADAADNGGEFCEDDHDRRMKIERIASLTAELARLKQQVEQLRSALALARPVLDDELQSMCESFCPPCEEGEVYDYSELSPQEKQWVTVCEAALDAADAALASTEKP
jgi:hypothetical protein